jgi:hypothetical protein
MDMGDAFKILYQNDAQVAPCMSAAWNDPAILKALKRGLDHKLDKGLFDLGFDYLVESNISWTKELLDENRGKLELVETRGDRRVWRFVR